MVLALGNDEPGRAFLTRVASEVERLGQRRTVEGLDESLGSFEAGDAAVRAFGEVDDSLLLDQLVEQAGLSPREGQVFALLRGGVPQIDIATRLGVATGTVGALASRVRNKLRAAAS